MHFPRALVLAVLLLLVSPLKAEADKIRQRSLLILWWNVENLFDTYDDPAAEDDEFTPQGERNWTEKKLLLKRIRIGTVLKAIRTHPAYGRYPDIIAFAETENRKVFSGTLAAAGLGDYLVAYHESRDPRGIDIGLAWNPRAFSFTGSKACHVPLDGRNTRDVIVAGFSASGEPIAVVLNHWPSRSFDAGWTEPNRIAAARVARQVVDSLRSRKPLASIVVMGDFNDPPESASVRQVLGSSFDRRKVQSDPTRLLYNCWNEAPSGGSYLFRGKWERIDQVMVSAGLLDGNGVSLDEKPFSPFAYPHMLHPRERKLYQTYDKGDYRGGYSDHLPLLLLLKAAKVK